MAGQWNLNESLSLLVSSYASSDEEDLCQYCQYVENVLEEVLWEEKLVEVAELVEKVVMMCVQEEEGLNQAKSSSQTIRSDSSQVTFKLGYSKCFFI